MQNGPKRNNIFPFMIIDNVVFTMFVSHPAKGAGSSKSLFPGFLYKEDGNETVAISLTQICFKDVIVILLIIVGFTLVFFTTVPLK